MSCVVDDDSNEIDARPIESELYFPGDLEANAASAMISAKMVSASNAGVVGSTSSNDGELCPKDNEGVVDAMMLLGRFCRDSGCGVHCVFGGGYCMEALPDDKDDTNECRLVLVDGLKCSNSCIWYMQSK